MSNIFLFLALFFLFTFIIGRVIEKINVPWIFASLLLGTALAVYNPFSTITNSDTFIFLSQLGMYLLLFIIGFEINTKSIKEKKGFIVKVTILTIFLATFFGAIIIHYIFRYNWFISSLVAVSFATVGEAILIPILEKFKIVNTSLGQAIIEIGALDDIIEVLTLMVVIILIGTDVHGHINVGLVLLALFLLFVLMIGFNRLHSAGVKIKFLESETLFLFAMFVLFLFLGIGAYAEATALAALLAGIALKNLIPEKKLSATEQEIKTVCYGFFAPIFFLWVGTTLNTGYLASYPLFIVLIVVVSITAKLLGSYVGGKKTLGIRQSLLLGIGLSVRFSTSIIIIKILFDSGFIRDDLYSIIVASSIIFTIIIPVLFSSLLNKWGNYKNTIQ